MNIIENSADRLVAQSKATGGYFTAGVMIAGGMGAVGYGLVKHVNFSWIAGLVVLGIGVIVLLSTRSELLTAERSSASVSVVTKGLTGQKQATYDFASVSEVRAIQQYHQVESGTGTTSPRGGGISFGTGGVGVGGSSTMQLETTTQLVMADGTSVVIESIRTNAGMGAVLSTQHSDGIGQALATFMGKPYQLVAPNMNPLAMVQAAVGAFRGNQAATGETVVPVAPVVPVTSVAPVAPAVMPSAPAPQPGNPEAAGFAMPVAQPVAPAVPVTSVAPVAPATASAEPAAPTEPEMPTEPRDSTPPSLPPAA